MAKAARPKPGPHNSKGRGPSQGGFDKMQAGKMDPNRELQAIIAASMGADPTQAGPPQRFNTFDKQIQGGNVPGVRTGEMKAMMQPDAVTALLQMILGGQAGGPPMPPQGNEQLQDVQEPDGDPDDSDHEYR